MTDIDGHGPGIRPLKLPRRTALLAVILLVVAAMTVTTAGTAQPLSELPAEPALRIALHDDGSALVTLVVSFDLATKEEREAFEILRTNATARELRTERFASRMRAIADRAEANAGREMKISQPAIEFTERNDTGSVALSVTWEGLAARSGDELVLREPFANGFTLDRSFHVIAPEGYRLSTVRPAPIEQSRTEATWAAGTSLEGFEATFIRSPTRMATQTSADVPETGADAPGFGIGIAVIALLLSAGFLLRRARHRP